MKTKLINGNLYLLDKDARIKPNTNTRIEGFNGDWFWNSIYNTVGRIGDITPYDFKIVGQQYQKDKPLLDGVPCFELPVKEDKIDVDKLVYDLYFDKETGECKRSTIGAEDFKAGVKYGLSLNQSTISDEEDMDIVYKKIEYYYEQEKLNVIILNGNKPTWENGFISGYNAKKGISREKYYEDIITILAQYRICRDRNEMFDVDKAIQSLNKQPEREVEMVIEQDNPSIQNILANDGKYKPKLHKKIVDGREYDCLTVKYK